MKMRKCKIYITQRGVIFGCDIIPYNLINTFYLDLDEIVYPYCKEEIPLINFIDYFTRR